MNGDEVLGTWFLRSPGGYDASEVDDLLRRVAVELDADRPARPLIENATFRARRSKSGYDIDAVDWFLGQLLRHPSRSELDRRSGDPWLGPGPVAQFTRRGADGPAERSAKVPRNLRRHVSPEDWNYFFEDCMNAWRDFDQQPGTYLRWARNELRAEQQTMASLRGSLRGHQTVRAGERNFTVKTWKSSPGTAEIAARSRRDYFGHFGAKPGSYREWEARRIVGTLARESVDETGMPVLYTSGRNFNGRAYACISFPDQRWLRFLVRGTQESHAIMTAVDQAGNGVVRYRMIKGIKWRRGTVEITVNPDWKLTDELVLAIEISAPWLASYFDRPEGG